jgi:hypothetical protein
MLRIVTRTHYQVHEPVYLFALLIRCTSPVRSDYSDRIADRIVEESSKLGHKLNRGAAGYLVDLGRALGLINENMVWTSLAHTVAVVSDRADRLDPALTLPERMLMLRVLLQFDGAAIWYLTRAALQNGRLPREGEDWNSLATAMMREVASAYLAFLTDPAVRTGVRQVLESRVRQPYSGKSGAHQCMFHLQAMSRVGLMAGSERHGRRLYTIDDDVRPRCERLLEAVPTLLDLERLAVAGDWLDVLVAVFNKEIEPQIQGWTEEEIFASLRWVYRRVAATGVSLVAIATLVDAMQVIALSRGVRVSRDLVVAELKKAQSRAPEDVRLHVDRAGRPAYVKFSEALLKSSSTAEIPTHIHD